tara:strand:+ start:5052 stop:5669 length:618 start_codon:yes stop_codon:yes gene_type:complete
MFKNHYWYMPEALTKDECDYLEEKGKQAFKDHPIDGFHFGENPSKRSSKIGWVSDPYAMSVLECAALEANDNAAWMFSLTEPEQIQYTTYKKDDGYDWHTDGHQDQYAAKILVETSKHPMPLNQTTNPRLAGLVRKLSLTVNLSHPTSYEGGTLELHFHNQTHVFDKCPRGSIIAFPSFIHHRISPIVKGTRKSAVMWFNGPPLR